MQRRWVSAAEAASNTAAGLLASLGAWQFIAPPLFGVRTHIGTSIGIVCLFTVISLVRGYVLRRVFNFGTWRSR